MLKFMLYVETFIADSLSLIHCVGSRNEYFEHYSLLRKINAPTYSGFIRLGRFVIK